MTKKLFEFDKPVHGIWRIMPSATITEIIAQSGFDFQILDCEHGAYDYQTLEADIRACRIYNTSPFVRVSGLNKVEVQRCLDLGAHGIVFPQLKDLKDFEDAVKLVRHAPEGTRGYNPFVRAYNYGSASSVPSGLPLCITIIETLEAVSHLEEILMSGIDMIYIGSYDLSAQLGCIGEMNNNKLLDIVNEITAKSNKHKVPVSLLVRNAEEARERIAAGINCIVHAVDTFHFKKYFTDYYNHLA